MRLVAVVLNWNGGEDTPAALASLEGIETICVDNGSTDGSDRAVEERFPQVELLRTGANLGFAGGNNAGIQRALERGADWVLLLNNDAVAEPGLAEALERAASDRPDAGVLACKVLSGDGRTVQYAGARVVAWLGYSGRERAHGGPDVHHEGGDVDRADGAAARVAQHHEERRTEVLNAVLQRADLGHACDVARDPHGEDIADALIEDHFSGHAGISARQYCSERMLARRYLGAAGRVLMGMREMAIAEARIARLESVERLRGGHGRSREGGRRREEAGSQAAEEGAGEGAG